MTTQYGVYEVTGKREYRGHKPGTVFEAALDGAAAQRAINRGDIVLLREFIPDLEEGSFRLPDPWPPGPRTSVSPATTEAPHGASLIEGGGG